MTHTTTHTHKSCLAAAACTALLSLGSVALPSAVFAADDKPDPAPLARPVPQSAAMPESAAAPSRPPSNQPGALRSTGGTPVIVGRDSAGRSSAWCEPFTNVCERHPWRDYD